MHVSLCLGNLNRRKCCILRVWFLRPLPLVTLLLRGRRYRWVVKQLLLCRRGMYVAAIGTARLLRGRQCGRHHVAVCKMKPVLISRALQDLWQSKRFASSTRY